MDPNLKKEKIFEENSFLEWKKRWEERSLKNNNTLKKCKELMRSNNPLVIPRNHKIEEALEAAEQNNSKPMNKILEILNKPYNEQNDIADYQSPSILNEKYQTFCGT